MSQKDIHSDIQTLLSDVQGSLSVSNGTQETPEMTVEILDENLLRTTDIDKLVYTSALSENEETKLYAQKLMRKVGEKLGIYSASINALYMSVPSFTTPAMNIRMFTYDICQRAFKVAVKHNMKAMVFELARTEQQYTAQEPGDYTASVIAAAIKEGYRGPVFMQGDHYQAKPANFKEDKQKEIERIKDAAKLSIEGGFYNIDIDASTIVDLSKENLVEQQRDNYETTAILTEYIRSLEPEGVTISIGGEIGHIGGTNSTVADFKAFMDGYLGLIKEKQGKDGKGLLGVSKVSVQTGSSHGGVVDADGKLADVEIDFNVLKDIAKVAHDDYHIGGPVQHGASTLPQYLFHQFPKNGTVEIHLATGFQNIVYEHLFEEVKQKIYTWLKTNCKDEWKESWSEEQFLYKLRKKGWGPFKKELWLMPADEKELFLNEIEKQFEFLFEQLGVFNSAEVVEKFVK